MQIAVKAVEQAKRSAEGSPDNGPSRKRAAFGDITNVSCGENIPISWVKLREIRIILIYLSFEFVNLMFFYFLGF